jgi:hypothetical protein
MRGDADFLRASASDSERIRKYSATHTKIDEMTSPVDRHHVRKARVEATTVFQKLPGRADWRFLRLDGDGHFSK